jgi:acetylornithine deacetylase/succinyl-diaminopimelate desuccinylase-like protein
MTDFSNIDAFLEDNLQTSLTELKKYCQQPSVAAQNLGMEETARMTAAMLEERGFDANLYTTEGFPVVIAERKGKTDKTLLIYNHYDVQPAEPFDLWSSPHLNRKSGMEKFTGGASVTIRDTLQVAYLQ